MPITVDPSVGIDLLGTNRNIVRTSSGLLYIIISDLTADVIKAYKSSDNGLTWNEQDSANRPADVNYTKASCAIDSVDIIHITYMDRDTPMNSGGARYATFHTEDAASNQDTWQTDEQLEVASVDPTTFSHGVIAIDSNDIPHVAWQDEQTSKGTDFNTVVYQNRIGGAWNGTGLVVEGAPGSVSCQPMDIAISNDNIPQILYSNETDDQFTAALGNQNDASSFELFDLFNATAINTQPNAGGMCIVKGGPNVGDTIVLYPETASTAQVRVHDSVDDWQTWAAAVVLDNTAELNMNLAVDKEHIAYVVTQNSNAPAEFHLFVSTDNGITWTKNKKLVADSAAIRRPKFKWSFNNDNLDDVYLDFVFIQGTDGLQYERIRLRKPHINIIRG